MISTGKKMAAVTAFCKCLLDIENIKYDNNDSIIKGVRQ